MVQQPDYLEEKLYRQALKRANKSMLERVDAYQAAQREYRKYVETQNHEIKAPIAPAQPIIDNHKNPVTRQTGALRRIDGYVEKAFYYAKSSTANQDYQIRRCGFAQLARDAITRNAPGLIRQGFSVDVSQAAGTVKLGGQVYQIQNDAPIMEYIATGSSISCFCLIVLDHFTVFREVAEEQRINFVCTGTGHGAFRLWHPRHGRSVQSVPSQCVYRYLLHCHSHFHLYFFGYLYIPFWGDQNVEKSASQRMPLFLVGSPCTGEKMIIHAQRSRSQ